jgi:protein O-GlcNAc transferase
MTAPGSHIEATLQSALRLHGAGRLGEAARLYQEILAANPRNAEAWHLQGVLAFQRRDAAAAVAHIQKALAIAGDTPVYLSNFGLALHAAGRLDDAVASFRRALDLKPDYADAAFNLGNVLQQMGELAAAAESYRHATSVAPDFIEAHHNLGNVLRRLHRLSEAADSYGRVLAARPDFAELHNTVGNIFQQQNRFDEAIAAHERALAIKPELATAWNNLGNALSAQGRLAEAETAFRRASERDPRHVKAHLGLALTFQAMKRPADALAAYDRVLALDPTHADARLRRFNLKLQLCDWSTLEADAAAIKAAAAAEPAAVADPYFLVFVPGVSAAEQRRTAEAYARDRFAPFRGRPRPEISQVRRDPDRPLRVGYLSTDFHDHATAYLLAEVIELHDRAQVQPFAYSMGPDGDGEMRRRLLAAFQEFRDVRTLSDDEAASRIAADGIDILVDLKGYTGGSRAEILALRPAPIQASYLGHPGTTGAAQFIDYLIADRVICPHDASDAYSEVLACLPNCYQPNDRQRRIADETPSRAELGLPERGLVFCSFNATYKVTPKLFDVWMALLCDVEGSVLWFVEEDPIPIANLRREAAARGVTPERLVFAPKLPLDRHLARYRRADLFLDTLPCSAHTTASDALWAGLPVLTCIGDTFAGRVGASIVRSAGLGEMVVADLDEYARRARHLAAHRDELDRLRRRLAAARASSPLFDTPRYTRDLEALYRRMWRRYVAGEPPATIDL